jgi:diguanylate cyclase (GGDEF)-like protein
MFLKISKKYSMWVWVFLIWFFSVIISALLTIIIIKLSSNKDYLLGVIIACIVATVASLATAIPSLLRNKKIIRMKDKIIELSRKDGLTKLYNRTYFMELYTELIEKTLRNNTSITVIIFDLDHFKNINDTYGHIAGDEVLENVGYIVKEILPTELSGRFGGEEFIVVLNKINKKDSQIIAKRIREKLDNNISYNGKEIQFSVSVGAAYCNNNYLDADTLIKIADDNLYKAKKLGRNNVSFQDIANNIN